MANDDMRFARPPGTREQLVLYSTCLDDMIPQDALVRKLDALMGHIDWTPWEDAYTGRGQPPIHPRYLASAILYGLMHGVRASRMLEELACKHVDYMWLLEGQQPDHSTFCKFRVRHEQGLKALHRQVAQLLVRAGNETIVTLLIDGTRIRANSGRQGARAADIMERIVQELDMRLEALQRGDEKDGEDQAPPQDPGPSGNPRKEMARLSKQIESLKKKRAKYKKALKKAKVRDAEARAHNGKKARAVRVPVTDPDSQLTPNKDGGFAPNYTPVVAVDAATGAIVYADVVEGSDEAGAVRDAVQATEQLTGHRPHAVAADTSFATGENLALLEQQGIKAYMPTRSASPPDNPALRENPTGPVAEEDLARLPRKAQRFNRTAFVYDADADRYYCPAGNALAPWKKDRHKNIARVHYGCPGAADCPCASHCVKKGQRFRTIIRDEYEPLREQANARMAKPAGQEIYRSRAPGVEGVFGHVKFDMGIRQFLLRTLTLVRVEWAWICTAHNIKKLLKASALPQKVAPNIAQAFVSNDLRPRYRSVVTRGASWLHTLAARFSRIVPTTVPPTGHVTSH